MYIDMNDNDYKTTLPKMGLKTRSYNMDMNKKDLKRLSKSQLIKLLLKQEAKKPIPPPRSGKWESVKPKPVPLKSVNEDIILPPPIPQVEEKEHKTNVLSSKIIKLLRVMQNHMG